MERHIEAKAELRTPLYQVAEVLRDRPGPVLSGRDEHPMAAGYKLNLHVEAGAATLHQEVLARLTPVKVHPDDGACAWDMTWEPADHGRLLPAFHGSLEAIETDDGTTLRLTGLYRPPLGPLGAFGDGVVGHHIARRALQSLLTEVSARIDHVAEAGRTLLGVRPAPYPDDLRD